jgi:tRNA modification GTPase
LRLYRQGAIGFNRLVSTTDTIFALSSGRPPAAIAVVRLSGPRAGDALKALTGRLPAPRQAALARVRDPASGELIDEALALWFPGPNSETGEDTAELQLHGGRAVIAAVLAALGRIEGLRPAEAGEFTRRAFENGKLDLTAVEGLADLIGAETEAQRRQAFRQLKGLLGQRAESWRQRLTEALALVEARIDFSDEADVPENLVGPALNVAQQLRSEIAEALAGAARGERLREGLVVAIAGPPNAGKSTLLNRIARREAAIVSPIPGTTRDVIEVHLDLDGYPVTLLDTAGIRDSADPVEQEGVRRARERAAAADLVLWVVEAGEPEVANKPPSMSGLSQKAGDHMQADSSARWLETPHWLVVNKIDSMNSSTNINVKVTDQVQSFRISAKTGAEVNSLIQALADFATGTLAGEPALVSRERHRRFLIETQSALDRALAEGPTGREDIIAEELRLAARALGRLTGRVDVEDILDVIFRDFCIGK